MVNVLQCSLSLWRGDGEMCRWCNASPARGGRKFCSRECTNSYANNHMYGRGKQIVLTWHKTCTCPGDIVSSFSESRYIEGRGVLYFRAQAPHVVCNACGECEETVTRRGDKITINHVTPRNGISCGEVNCIHHLDNLEPVCWRDHEVLNKIGNSRGDLAAALASLGYRTASV